MHYFDIVVFAILIFFTVRGLFRGLISELMVLVALVFGFTAATYFHPLLQVKLLHLFPSFSDTAAKVTAYITIFALVNIFFRILGNVLNKIATFTFLQPVNKIAGAVFSFTKTALMLSVIIVIVEIIPGSSLITGPIKKAGTITYAPLKSFGPVIYNFFFKSDSGKSFKDVFSIDKIISDSTAAKIPFKDLLK